jgi:hypothetical protein
MWCLFFVCFFLGGSGLELRPRQYGGFDRKQQTKDMQVLSVPWAAAHILGGTRVPRDGHFDLLRTACAPTSTHSNGFCASSREGHRESRLVTSPQKPGMRRYVLVLACLLPSRR